jgi:hypothetical protein
MIRVDDVPGLAAHMPRTWRSRALHIDPDLTSSTPTYGDNCRRAGRAFSLRRAQSGDVIVFVARLQPVTKPAGFYLVGCLEIEDLLLDVTTDPGPGWWDVNAHVRRARATRTWDSFWVFKGSPRSRFFNRAVAFARDDLSALLSNVLRWGQQRTELQTIASYTRAVRRVEGPGEEWLRSICRS